MNSFYWNDAAQRTRDITKPFLQIGYVVYIDAHIGPQFNARLPFTGICPCNLKIDWGNLTNPHIINIPKGTNITEQLIAHNFDWYEYLDNNEKYSNVIKIYSDNDWMPDWVGGGNQITNIQGSFLKCNNLANPFYSSYLKSIDVKIFDIIGSSITKMNNFFGRCIFYNRDGYEASRLSTIPAGIFDKLVNCTDFSSCFGGSSITSIPADLFKYNTKVTTFNSCFKNSDITNLPKYLFKYNANASDFGSCFENCNSLNFNDFPSVFYDWSTVQSWEGDGINEPSYAVYDNPNFRNKKMNFSKMCFSDIQVDDYDCSFDGDPFYENKYSTPPETYQCFSNRRFWVGYSGFKNVSGWGAF